MTTRINSFLVLAFVTAVFTGNANAESAMLTPAIKQYAPIHAIPGPIPLKPDVSTTYKVVFDLSSGKTKDGVNDGFWHVARAVNLFEHAGVDKEHRQFAVVVHGKATPAIMADEAYQRKHGKSNPNTDIMKALSQSGVDIFVCGQAAKDRGLESSDISSHAQLTLSALTDIPVLQNRGYSLYPLSSP